jgi:hypothetical protein
MRLERAAIALEPRPVGNCLDLAVVFAGRQPGKFLSLSACFAVPLIVAICSVARVGQAGLLWAVAFLSLASAPLGVCLTAAATHAAFNEQWSLGQVLWNGIVVQWRTTVLAVVLRCVQTALPLLCLMPVATIDPPIVGLFLILLAALCLTPGIALGVYAGFLSESSALKPFRRQTHDHRTQDLVHLEYTELLFRALTVWAFGAVLWGVLALTVDVAATLMLGVPLILGRIAEAVRSPWGEPQPDEVLAAFLQFCTTDAAALATLAATALIVYAICRLAWFFTYVDLRIRRDCWDLEVALAEEARRLEAPT